MSSTRPATLAEQVRAVAAPPAVLSRERERSLTPRQREILGELGRIFDKGFADLTMAELAAQLNCSLRTLYGLASSRDELVLMVVDRNLRTIGRAAHAAIEPHMTALEAVQAYLGAATVAVSDLTEEFANDMSEVAAGVDLNEAHSNYLVDVTRALLDVAVAEEEIAPVDTAAVARVVAGLGRDFARPDVMTQLATTPKAAADAMLEVVLAGLPRSR